jgi:hypothetical protein
MMRLTPRPYQHEAVAALLAAAARGVQGIAAEALEATTPLATRRAILQQCGRPQLLKPMSHMPFHSFT